MENATKALMIAGAVLLAIMIIGVGMLIFNNAQGTIGGAATKMKQQEIDLFNNQFTSYEGTQSGSNVKSLISTVMSSNSVALSEGTEAEKTVTVTVDGKGGSDNKGLTEARNAVTSGKKYTVAIEYRGSGLVEKITCTVQDTKKGT